MYPRQSQHGPSVLGQGTSFFETRVKIEVGYYLVLNPMTGNLEAQQAFGPWPSKQALRDWYLSERVEQYSDEGANMFAIDGGAPTKSYRKSFRKDGPLEWCNSLNEFTQVDEAALPLELWGRPNEWGHGVYEQLVNLQECDANLRLPTVPF